MSFALACVAWSVAFQTNARALAQSSAGERGAGPAGCATENKAGHVPAGICANRASSLNEALAPHPPAAAGETPSGSGVRCNRPERVPATTALAKADTDKDDADDYPDFAASRLSSESGPVRRQDSPSGRDKPADDERASTKPISAQGGQAALPSVKLTGSPETQLITIAVKRERELTFDEPIERIAVQDPAVAQIRVLSPTQAVLTGESIGTTQLAVDSSKGTRSFVVVIEPNLDLLREIIASVAPGTDVQLRAVNGSILLTGAVPDARTSELIEQIVTAGAGSALITHLQVAGVQQTMLRVVIAEVNKEALRELGVNWAVGGSTWSRDFFFANNVSQLNPTVFSSSGLPDVLHGQQAYSVAATANGTNTNLTFGFPRAEMQWFLNALRQNGLARTLAEPNLVAFSGQTATFLAGGEVPIPVVQSGTTSGAITITYKEFGVRLAFTPTILGGQIIRLHVMSEVSDALPGEDLAGALPLYTFTTRRVESTIECGNGQTFVIGGLLRDTVRATVSKIPGLGDLPVLGAMFSSTSYQNSETEMLVLVTPQLVEPFDSQKVSDVPGGQMRHPTDFELFGLGQLEGTSRKPAPKGSDEANEAHKGENGAPGAPVASRKRETEPDHQASALHGLRGSWGFEYDQDGK